MPFVAHSDLVLKALVGLLLILCLFPLSSDCVVIYLCKEKNLNAGEPRLFNISYHCMLEFVQKIT